MIRAPRVTIFFVVLLLPSAVPSQVQLSRAKTQGDLPPSFRQGGLPGDYVLSNDRVAFVITDVNHHHRSAASGGNVVDASLFPAGHRPFHRRHLSGADELDQVLLFLGKYPRQGRYQTLKAMLSDDRSCAELILEGIDSHDGSLSVTTRYRLRSHVPYLELETTVENRGPATLTDFMLGDAIHWGLARPFAPLFGFGIARNEGKADWVGGSGDGIAYGWVCPHAPSFILSGLNWTDPIAVTTTLPPGGSIAYRRYLIVGRDLAEVARWAYQLIGKRPARIVGQVQSRRGQFIASVTVEASPQPPIGRLSERLVSQTGAIALARSDGTGAFEFWLPQGTYRLQARPRDRWPLRSAVVKAHVSDLTPVMLWVSEPALLRFRITDESGLIPGRLTFLGTNSTPDPNLGPDYRASGAANYIYAPLGTGQVTLPPGNYRVVASRGPAYDSHTADLFLPEGGTVDVIFRLRKALTLPDWLSADFHTHSAASFDSAVALRDRLVSALCEGLDIIVLTDHNVVTDPKSLPSDDRLLERLMTLPGVEVTTPRLGHFTVFPLEPNGERSDGGAPPFDKTTATELFSAIRSRPEKPILIVNHPRFGNLGYFHIFRFPNPEGQPPEGASGDFDGLELMNGKAQDDLGILLRDWFSFLNQGKRVVAVGGSDSHGLVWDEVGYPRNYISVGDGVRRSLTADQLKTAILRGALSISLGPFVHLTLKGQAIGSMLLPDERGRLPFTILVQSPNWVVVNRVELIGNGRVIKAWEIKKQPSKSVHITLSGTVDVRQDTWFIAVASGPAGGLEPVVKPFRDRTGRLIPVQPMAVTNPIWVDADGDGHFRIRGRLEGGNLAIKGPIS